MGLKPVFKDLFLQRQIRRILISSKTSLRVQSGDKFYTKAY